MIWFRLSQWLAPIALLSGAIAAATALRNRKTLHAGAFLVSPLCMLLALLCHHIAWAPMIGMSANPDGGPISFNPNHYLIVAYTGLQILGFLALITGAIAFVWRTWKNGTAQQAVSG